MTTPEQFDRLVDGECTEGERRAILLRLDAEPDGWRRCALAFLEDQALRSILGGPASPIPLIQPSPPIVQLRRRGMHLGRLAVAASLVVATFAAGFRAGESRIPLDPIALSQAKVPDATPQPDDSIREVGWASVAGDAAEGLPAYRVPILAGSGIDDRWLQSRPSTVPDYVRAQWEREGFQVAEKRRLMSINLDDGRKLAIPVANVEVEYVGQDTY